MHYKHRKWYSLYPIKICHNIFTHRLRRLKEKVGLVKCINFEKQLPIHPPHYLSNLKILCNVYLNKINLV